MKYDLQKRIFLLKSFYEFESVFEKFEKRFHLVVTAEGGNFE